MLRARLKSKPHNLITDVRPRQEEASEKTSTAELFTDLRFLPVVPFARGYVDLQSLEDLGTHLSTMLPEYAGITGFYWHFDSVWPSQSVNPSRLQLLSTVEQQDAKTFSEPPLISSDAGYVTRAASSFSRRRNLVNDDCGSEKQKSDPLVFLIFRSFIFAFGAF
ncbi:hypothetical protein F2P81_011309 [Scophthalmus maximus]|uniref:Uncharacterized protein n=1 Tax=Scophthalmus maximus TaxID=52904 RepID=A0A6A4SRH4_SCOMX|nr:hypothetical protein F2P81_011309 [Scophthalmus maximus]